MLLKEKITSDIKAAMKSADSFRVGALRLLSSALHNEEIAKKTRSGDSILEEHEVIAILKREAKKRKESISVYSLANREDLVAQEEQELNIIQEYLPKEPTASEIELVVQNIMKSGAQDFPSIMKSVMAEFKGSADGKVVAEIIKSALG